MSGAACLVWDDRLTRYDFGPQHPLAPVRLELTLALARDLGLLAGPAGDPPGSAEGAPADGPPVGLEVVPAPTASSERLATVHDPAYIAQVRRASLDCATTSEAHRRYGLDSPDNPVFAGMHDASAHVVGATVEAARRVWTGRAEHAVSLAGGLHHARPAAASGFCVYNDVAVAIRWLLEAGCERVAYVDTDAHHGDGVEEVFAADPRVLTVSLHESTQTLFPYRGGRPGDVGAPGAEGFAVNVALPAGTGDPGWLHAFDAVVPPLLRAFRPDILVTQHGCDGHALDPLTHLALTVDALRGAAWRLHDLAHELCAGRWVATGGGGYALAQVVPRAWTHLLGIAAGTPVDPRTQTPASWRSFVRQRHGGAAPERMSDARADREAPASGLSAGSPGTERDGASPVEQAVAATKAAVFPCHGLDPS